MQSENKGALSLRTEKITKRFPGIIACDAISMTAQAGKALAVVGENGAGKTTLMNMLIGLYTPSEGKIFLGEQEVSFTCPEDAILSGIGMVHQQYMLVPNMTVCENIALGMQQVMKRAAQSKLQRFKLSLKTDMAHVRARIREVSESYGLSVDPDAYIWQLSVGEQQRVELIKTLCIGAKVLILDEPTSALTPQETGDLLALLKRMAGSVTILFISHKIAEIKELCEDMVILRSGKLVFSGKTASYSAADIAAMMTGREVKLTMDCPARNIGDDALIIRDLFVKSDRGSLALNGLNLTVRSGEIVGLAGVSGNGQQELAEALNGLRKIKSGSMELYGNSLANKTPRQVIDLGMGYVPAERNVEGIVPSMSIKENLVIKDINSPRLRRHGLVNPGAVKRNAVKLCVKYDVRTSSIDLSAGSLSGGNIQKVILAREIARNPKFLVAVYPIRGLDMGAAEFVHNQMIELRDSGVGILLISEEIDEILNVSDRIAVICKGTIRRIMEKKDASSREIGIEMAGVTEG